MSVIRPDGIQLQLLSLSLPNSQTQITHDERIFSTDSSIRKNLFLQKAKFSFDIDGLSSEDILFSSSEKHEILKGNYIFLVNENDFLSSFYFGDDTYP